MVRLIFWFAVLCAITFGVTWLADSPGQISIVVRGYQIQTQSIGIAVLAIGLLFVSIWLAWGLLKWVLGRPSALGGFFGRRRERKGRQALSTGLVAIGAGDEAAARKAATIASRMLPSDPLAQLLAAQSAQQQGDSAKVKQVYREMSKVDETKLLGLRGLFNEARREKNIEAARQIATDALNEHPGVSWASNAMLVSYAAENDWPAVLSLLDNQLKAKIITKEIANTKKAVALTAQAIAAEDSEPPTALELATKAHKLDPSLVPAALVAARTNATVGSLRKASKILEQTWRLAPHPDIAEVYAHLRAGDSVADRLAKIQNLVRVFHAGQEGSIALAVSAIDAQDWKTARESLNPYVNDQPSARICTLMAEIETREFGDKGKAREWLARAVHAPADPVWTAQGVISPEWKPISPVSGELGVFEWKVPVQGLGYTESQRATATEPFMIPLPVETAQDISKDIAEEKIEEVPVVVIDADKETEASSEPEEKPADIVADEKTDDEAEVKTKQTVSEAEGETSDPSEPVSVSEKKSDKEANSDQPKLDEFDVTQQPVRHPPDDPGLKKTDEKSGESWFG